MANKQGFVIGALLGAAAGAFLEPMVTKRKGRVLGAVLGGLAGSFFGANSKIAIAALPGAGQTVTFQAGTIQNQSVKAGIPTTFKVPDGTMQFLTIDATGVLGGAVSSYGPVTLTAGSHVVAVQWTGADGTTNMATVNLTAS